MSKHLKSKLEQPLQRHNNQNVTKTNPRLFDELGLVGGWDIDDTKLSTNYK